MNCKRAKRDIALQVGGDLDDAQAQKLRLHLAVCPSCSDYSKQMEAGYGVLRAPAEDDVAVHDEKSIWPDLSNVLTRRAPQPRSVHLTGWVPATAAVAACLLIAASSYFTRPSAPQVPVPSRPVSTQNDPHRLVERFLNKQQTIRRQFPNGQQLADPLSMDAAPVRLPPNFEAPRDF